MKFIYLIYIILINSFSTMSNANNFELDKLDNPGITTQGERWSFFTDSVMGAYLKVNQQ